jgi:hypothetical protein
MIKAKKFVIYNRDFFWENPIGVLKELKIPLKINLPI